jgi:hypothetical protein
VRVVLAATCQEIPAKGGQAFAVHVSAWFFKRPSNVVSCLGRGRASVQSDVAVPCSMLSSVLKDGIAFRWTTFGLPLESKIREFVPFTRIGWYGYAPGTEPTFYHTWYLTGRGNGCQVVTDEVGNGPDAANLRQTDEGLMHRGHDLWLATLRWVAENKSN